MFYKMNKNDFRPPKIKEEQDKFVNDLLQDDKLYEFANKILFDLIKKSINVGFDEGEIIKIIDNWVIDPSGNKKILGKPAYRCNIQKCKDIIDIKTLENFLKYNKENNISFLQIMGAMYGFTANNKFIKLCIDKDVQLQELFTNTMKEYFSIPESLKYEELCVLIDKSRGHWFYPWVMSFLANNNKNLFHRGVVNDSEYIRNQNRSINTSEYKTIDKKDSLKQTQYENYTDEDKLMLGTTYYTIDEKSIWYKLMKKYQKEVISGPSGSSSLNYQLCFNITKILEPTNDNKINLLLCIIADYYQNYHSISEILQEYSVNAGFSPHYTLESNDLDYIKKLKNLKNEVFGLIYELSFGTSYNSIISDIRYLRK
jgi:hypothetical protein